MEILRKLGARRAVTALLALLIAFGAGYLVQVVFADRTPLAKVDHLPDAAPLLRSSGEAPALPTPPAATLVPLMPPPPVLPDRVDQPESTEMEDWDDARTSPFGFDCAPSMTLKLRDASIVEASLLAPCDLEKRVSFLHDKLRVDVMTDAFGRAKVLIPALSEAVLVTAELGQRKIQSELYGPRARAYSRVVLSWEGNQIFRMNAFELGAKPGEAGHISSASPKTASRAMRGTGGFMFVTGDGSGRVAEVYSFPTGYSPFRGIVELIVEADVTENVCGQLAEAQALQSNPLGGVSETTVRVTLPDCDKVGDVMVLKSLLQDMRLAGR